jgi:hypothetical protein
MTKGLAVLAVLLAGCDLYFGGGDDAPCDYGGGASPAYEVRDPATGQCTTTGGGYCPDSCGPCSYETQAGAIADWGQCYGQCYGLDEQSCFATSGCYAAYLDDPTADGKRDFWGCWNTAPSGPVQGQCINNDAYECSRHDDCIAIYTDVVKTTAGTSFQQCADEPATYCLSNSDCGSDAWCDHTVCYPAPCPSCPTCGACPDTEVCYGVCVPKEPRACEVIDCGTGYHCEEQCTPGPMGYCEPACVQDLTCASVDCAPGYVCAQVCNVGSNGQLVCGPTCLPDNQGPACESLMTEIACIGRMDCIPVYDGDQCTCYPDHCECQVLTYARCETL